METIPQSQKYGLTNAFYSRAITLEMLKKANNYGDNYDLSLLKKCDNKTSVTISLNNQKQIINYEYELKCN